MGRQVERLPPPPPRPVVLPDAVFGWYESVLVLDAAGQWWFESLSPDAVAPPTLARSWSRAVVAVGDDAARGRRRRCTAPPSPSASSGSRRASSSRRTCACGSTGSSPATRRRRSRRSSALEPAYGAYFGLDDGGAVLSFSPELFLRRVGASSRPRRSRAPRRVVRRRRPRARRARGVREGRGRARDDRRPHAQRPRARRGVRDACTPPRCPTSRRTRACGISSRGCGRRCATASADDELLRATFPPGSVTGAPKVQALKVISAWRAREREVYTGAIGYVSPVAGLEMNVAIRTLEVRGVGRLARVWGRDRRRQRPRGRAARGARQGAADRRGARLFRSCRPRACRAVAGARAPAPRTPRPGARRLHDARRFATAGPSTSTATSPVSPRPPPSSTAALTGRTRRAGARGAPATTACGSWSRPTATVDVTRRPPPPARPPTCQLRPAVLVGGLGEHKWADRTPLDDHPDALILDLDGTVLESATANVWAIEGDTLVTPPADGRILPGIVRDRLLDRGAPRRPHAREEPLALDRLRHADGIVVTSSIRIAAAGRPRRRPSRPPAPARVAEKLRHSRQLRSRPRAGSSVGQSSGLIIRQTWVRVPPGPSQCLPDI